MATNFKVWIDKPDATSAAANVTTVEDFNNDEARIAGWKAGDAISSLKMNSILRQNSLIAVALVEAFLSKTTLGMLSSVDEMKTEMLAAIAMKSDVTLLSASLSSLRTNVSTLQDSIDTAISNINAISDGSSTAGNAAKLGGNLPEYYQKKITYGTSIPSGGSDGDIYIKYS